MKREKKWTPGDWYISEFNDGLVLGGPDYPVVGPAGLADCSMAAPMCKRAPEYRANARLIAQAPRLVEALEHMVRVVEPAEADFNADEQVAMDRAREVLAAVYGESDERDT